MLQDLMTVPAFLCSLLTALSRPLHFLMRGIITATAQGELECTAITSITPGYVCDQAHPE